MLKKVKMPRINFMNTFTNPFVKVLARSPLHNLVDQGVILIIFTGRKSGKSITVPVNYLLDEQTIHVISIRHRNWWRNLKGGASVEVLLKGKQHNGWAVLEEEQKIVARELDMFCGHNPKYAQFLKVGLNPDGIPDPKQLLDAARDRVAIIIKLS